MVSFNARITAYDCMEMVEWTAKCWDQDWEPGDHWERVIQLSGSMRGQGVEHPTRWLRELLEDIREAL